MLPSGLKKQLANVLADGFVVNRNLHQPCLVLYPNAEWEKMMSRLNKLNRLIKKNDVFVRKVMGGATLVDLDGAGRVLLPKSLMDHGGLVGDVKVIGSNSTVEIWSKSAYEAFINDDQDMESLAEDVFGSFNGGDDE